MKLVLGSAPEGVAEVTNKIVELVGKPAHDIKVAVLNEASAVEICDMRWFIDGLTTNCSNVSLFSSFLWHSRLRALLQP